MFQVEQDAYIRSQEHVKVLCDDMAAAGVLFTDHDAFGIGNKVYNKVEAESALKNLIKLNMKLDEVFSPLTESYWENCIQYNTYYFDDLGFMTSYTNGEYSHRERFVYGTIFTEPDTGYLKLITEATVIVTISADYPVQMAKWIDWPKIVRSSAYEDMDRN